MEDEAAYSLAGNYLSSESFNGHMHMQRIHIQFYTEMLKTGSKRKKQKLISEYKWGNISSKNWWQVFPCLQRFQWIEKAGGIECHLVKEGKIAFPLPKSDNMGCVWKWTIHGIFLWMDRFTDHRFFHCYRHLLYAILLRLKSKVFFA